MMGSRAYSKVVQVFHMYEHGKLKDQKPIKVNKLIRRWKIYNDLNWSAHLFSFLVADI